MELLDVMPILNPAHPGQIVRGCMEAKGWTVTECAANFGIRRAEDALQGPLGRH